MNATDLINKLMNYYGDTPVVIFKDDEQFEIKESALNVRTVRIRQP